MGWNIPNVRQHDTGGCLRLDLLDRLVLLHVGNTVNDRIDLAGKSATVLKSTLGCTELNFPAGIEVLGARQDDVGVVLDKNTGEVTERDQGGVTEGGVEGYSGGQEDGHLTETDTVIPDVQGTLALGLAEDTVGGTDEVVGDLEDVGDALGDGDGEDEQVWNS